MVERDDRTKVVLRRLMLAALLLAIPGSVAMAQGDKPNILVIFGDDIGTWNVGVYSHGMMGWTPNITTASRAAPPDAPRSSWGRCRSGPA